MFRDTETFATPAALSATPLHDYDHGGFASLYQATHSLRRIDAQAIAMDPQGVSALTRLAYATAATCGALVWC